MFDYSEWRFTFISLIDCVHVYEHMRLTTLIGDLPRAIWQAVCLIIQNGNSLLVVRYRQYVHLCVVVCVC